MEDSRLVCLEAGQVLRKSHDTALMGSYVSRPFSPNSSNYPFFETQGKNQCFILLFLPFFAFYLEFFSHTFSFTYTPYVLK